MAYIPEDDTLEEILIALRDEETAIREKAIVRLECYVNTAGSPPSDSLTKAEALEEWGRNRKTRLQEMSIVEGLLSAIDDPSDRVRSHASLMLGHPTAPEAQAALLRHLREDPVDQVRAVCAIALSNSPDTPRKVQGFIDALQDSRDLVVSSACLYLGKIGDSQAIEPLRAVLSHSSWDVRFKACEALVRLQAVDPHIVSLLEELNQQAAADKHNETVRKVNKLSAEFVPTAERARSTQEVLDEARRALP